MRIVSLLRRGPWVRVPGGSPPINDLVSRLSPSYPQLSEENEWKCVFEIELYLIDSSCFLLVRGSATPHDPIAYHMSVRLRLCQRPVNDRKQLFTFERLHHMATGTLLKPPELVTLLSL